MIRVKGGRHGRQPNDPGSALIPTIQSDAGLRLHFIDGVPHVLDTDLGTSLGMAQPRNIRATIRKRLDKLERLGTTHAVRESFISGNRAERKTKAYYLNEKQALLFTSLSETERGWDLHILLIEVFTAWRQGKLPSVAGHAALNPPEAANAELLHRPQVLRQSHRWC